MSRRFTKLAAMAIVMAIAVSLFAGSAPVKAAEKTVKQVEDFDTTVTVFNKTFKASNGAKAKVNITYPVLTIKDNKKLEKQANKVIVNQIINRITAPYKDKAWGEDFDPDTVINIEGSYLFPTEENENEVFEAVYLTGNILNVSVQYTGYIEGGAYPSTEAFGVNIDMTTGKLITVKNLFKTPKKLRNAIGKYVLNQCKEIGKDAELSAENEIYGYLAEDEFFKDIAKNGWEMGDLLLDYNGMYVVFDETQLGVHAYGIVTFYVPEEVYASFIKPARLKTLFPDSMLKVLLPERSTGTGYIWMTAEENAKVLTLVQEGTVPAYHAPGMTGYPVTDYYVYKSNDTTGKIKLTYKLARPWDPENPADVVTYELIVSEDGLISEAK